MNVTNSWKNTIEFSWHDYCLFSIMVVGSAAVGIYFGYFNKQTTLKDYLLGGRKMGAFPISMSLLASQMSGLLILAMPTDVYKYGASFIFSLVSVVVTCLAAAYITMPVFHGLQITSIYEYLMLRFDRRIRIIASFVYSMNVILYLPLVIYVPALAFTQVTSVDLHVINVIICTVCIFYTAIGGLKAVVWTDILQFSAMVTAVIALLFVGLNSIGGLEVVFNRAETRKRLDVDFDINPLKRDTLWAVVFGFTLYLMTKVCADQGFAQKCLALPTISNVRRAILIYGCGTAFFHISGVLTGLFMYATYYDCDPLTTKQVEHEDQLLPYYVMEVAHNIPGLPGIFIAGVFCASMSTLSAQINAVAGIVYEDFLFTFLPKGITQKRINTIIKLIVICVGVICTSLVFVVQHLGELFSLTVALSGITFGPLMGLFILGMVFPSANSKGAFIGNIASLLVMSTIVVGNQIYKLMGDVYYPSKPLSTEGCGGNFSNITTIITQNFSVQGTAPALFKISHYYYVFIGVVILLATALPISWLTKSDTPIDEALITPCMRWSIPISRRLHFRENRDELVKLNDKL